MRSLLLAVMFVLLTAKVGQAQTIDPIARARDGMIECIGPDTVARTCEGISSYRVLDGGVIAYDAAVHIQNDPTIIVHVTGTLSLRDGMLCERVQRAAIDAARITVDGQSAPEDVSQEIKRAIWKELADVEEICSRYTAEGEGAALAVYLDGVEKPDLADRVIWVRPEDGYTLGVADASPT